MPDEGPGRDYSCPYMGYRLLGGDLVAMWRCKVRRRCRNCAQLMAWDDEAWIRRGVDYWLSQGASLVFLTLTLTEPCPYKAVSEMWRVYKQALDRLVKGSPGYLGGLPFARVFERQEKRYQCTGETAVHVHVMIAGLQYRGDRLGRRSRRAHYLKAEELELDGAVVTKAELQALAERYGFGPMLDITQVQASTEDSGAAFEVGRYLGKYLAKFEGRSPSGSPRALRSSQGPEGGSTGQEPGVTRLDVRRERLEAVRARREAGRAALAPAHPSEPQDDEWEQLELPIPWPPPRVRRRY